MKCYTPRDDQHCENLINENLYILELYAEKKMYSLMNTRTKDISKNEIISIGYEGLYQAALSFDASLNDNFFGYAWRYIDLAFKSYQRKIDPLHQDTRQQIKKINKANNTLTQSLGRTPTEKEISQSTNLEIKQIKKIKRLGLNSIQYDDISDGTQEIENGELPVDMQMEKKERNITLGKDMNDCLETALSVDQKQIVELMFLENLNAETIAIQLWDRYGVKEKNFIYNTVKSGKNKLKKCMQKKGWSITDI